MFAGSPSSEGKDNAVFLVVDFEIEDDGADGFAGAGIEFDQASFLFGFCDIIAGRGG